MDDIPQAEFKFNSYKNNYRQELKSRRDNIPQAEFKFNPYKNNYRQELKSRMDDIPQAEFKFNPYKNNYKQELKSRRDDITQAGVSTPVHKSPTQPNPRRGDRENPVEIKICVICERKNMFLCHYV